MASRRDELNAYSFARKRTNAAFLKPLPNGSIESAPKPLKAVVPGIVMSVLVLVGFGACGILKPIAPQGWNDVGGNVLVGSKSTTRYVVLNPKGSKEKILHPVLNLASAKLLVDPQKFQVVQVDEDQLDGKIAHGPALGIPFAPDRMPGTEDVDKPKTWAVCNRPSSVRGNKPQQAVFVLGGKEKEKFARSQGKLDLHQALFVQDPKGDYYLVDNNGVAFKFDVTMGGHVPMSQAAADRANQVLRTVVFQGKAPQQVTDEWMKTLITSPIPLYMPTVPGAGGGRKTSAKGDVPDKYSKIGTVVQDSASGQKYVVTQDDVEEVSDFIANLLTKGPNAAVVNPGGNGRAMDVPPLASAAITAAPDEAHSGHNKEFMGQLDFEIGGQKPDNPWPKEDVEMANSFKDGSQTSGLPAGTDDGVTCNFYEGTSRKIPGTAQQYPYGVPTMGAWVGTDYPAKIPSGATSYVTPGDGLLYREVKTPKEKPGSGSMFLVTDTGLRYSVPNNNDGVKAGKGDDEVGLNQAHLGYAGARVPSVLEAWSRLLSSGPSLTMQDAKQPQAS
ncbi:type VII secretion protein EccB [Streptomyces sp. NPDC048650]|uniref:type VII secretion protein EccB n=1 Tax=unclassified Streptomyces TaxID=2593676 RepID=UPI00371D36BC